jgi:hypothetical protein
MGGIGRKPYQLTIESSVSALSGIRPFDTSIRTRLALRDQGSGGSQLALCRDLSNQHRAIGGRKSLVKPAARKMTGLTRDCSIFFLMMSTNSSSLKWNVS